MSVRKQQLLKQHRRNKRMAMLAIVLCLLVLGFMAPLWLLPLTLVLLWVAHEAWFADHLFYAPQDDYQYRFPEGVQPLSVSTVNGRWQLPAELVLNQQATVIAKVQIKRTWLGRWCDPSICVGNDQQTFERGAQGIRYLNLTGQAQALVSEGLAVQGKFCRIAQIGRAHV